jgi:hypothetical protein
MTATTGATGTPTPVPPSPTLTLTPEPETADEPRGFPLPPETRLGVVVGEMGARTLDESGGPGALEYSRDAQPSDDATAANASGWNCRVHVEYEGSPAVDWYLAEGTPLIATMDGVATLHVITLANAFAYYGVDAEPYLGDPDRARAPLSPFPGPGGGKGVFVEVTNDGFALEYAHLALGSTLELVPGDAFVDGFSRDSDYAGMFSEMRGFQDSTVIAAWPVKRGDVVGFSGNSGYSEAPHLHYTVRRAGGRLLCPTLEAGFADGGWLFR